MKSAVLAGAAALAATALVTAGGPAAATATKTDGAEALTPYQQVVQVEIRPEDVSGGSLRCTPIPLPAATIVTVEQMSAVTLQTVGDGAATIDFAEIQVAIPGGDEEHHVFDINEARRSVRIAGPVHLGLGGSTATACLRASVQTRVTFRLSGYERPLAGA